MAISKSALTASIAEILKGADLEKISSKKVRLALEKKFKMDLTSRKEEITDLVMKMITASDTTETSDKASESEEEKEEASEDSDSTGKSPPKKRKPSAQAKQKGNKKTKQENSSEEEEVAGEDDENDDKDKANDEALAREMQKEELQSRTRAAKKSTKAPRAAKTTTKSSKKPATGKKNNSGYTREYVLSPELADVVGASQMARHEVVKKIWAVVKERNLNDPADKRFAICDDQMFSVFRVKRFRTFAMMKYLTKHFLEPS